MKSKVLKAIIIIAFIGIIAVVAIVLMNNHNVEDKGYKAIVEQNKSIDINAMMLNASGVKAKYHDVTPDDFAVYLTAAFEQLDEGISYYFNYFDNVKGMSRQAKDDLVKLNKAYIDQLKVAKTALSEYYILVNDPLITADQVNQVPARSANFLKEFSNAYAKGSEYFRRLSQEIRQLVFKSNVKDFTMIAFEMGDIFAAKSISFVKQNMEARIAGRPDQPTTANTSIQNFLKLYNKLQNNTSVTPSTEMVNETYYNFIQNYNKIDGAKLLDDQATYIASVDADTKAAANAVREFLQSAVGFGLVI